MAIAGVSEVVRAFCRSDFGQCVCDCRDQGVEGPRGGFSQQSFDLGEELLDRIEIGTVSGKVSQFGACGFDGLLDAGHFVAGKIVHHDDVASTQGGDEALLDIGAEALAVHRAVEDTGSGDFAAAQSCNERRRFPMSPRHRGEQAFPARAAAVATCHVGAGTGFIDEDQAFRVQFSLARMPILASFGDVRPILLGGPL
jgi:hypothetical protein